MRFVEDDEVELVGPLDRRFEGQVAARRLELLRQGGGSGVRRQLGQVPVVGSTFALCPFGERPPHIFVVGMRSFLEHPVHLGVVHDEGLLGAHRASPSIRRAAPSGAGPSAGPSPLRAPKRPS